MVNKYQIKIEVNFRAGHRLLPPYEGKCNNPHGEGYTAIIEFETEMLDQNGMVFDFGDIKKGIKEWVDNNWDHSYIHHEDDIVAKFLRNNLFKTFDMGKKNPTAENMAKCLYNVIYNTITTKVSSVGIVESFRDSIAYYKRGEEE